MTDDNASKPRAWGVATGLSVVRHSPEEAGMCSLRTWTFDAEGAPTVTILDLEPHQVERLYRALGDILDPGAAT
jgi:hypothetical protein